MISRDSNVAAHSPATSFSGTRSAWRTGLQKQWYSTVPIVVLTSEELWDRMDLNNLWEPTFTVCYDITADDAGSVVIKAQDRGK